MTHTKGPWTRVKPEADIPIWEVWKKEIDRDDLLICRMYETGNQYNDVNLIAAAPEMLEALKYALQRLKELQEATNYPTSHPQIKIEEVIAKAEGKNDL